MWLFIGTFALAFLAALMLVWLDDRIAETRSLRSAMEILVPAEWLAREKKSSASISKLRIISLYFPPLINALASLKKPKR